jgi:hypothetical protein
MVVCWAGIAMAQPAAKTNTAVPRLVKFSGTLTDGGGKPLSGVVGVTFALYQEQEGGAPVWMETQNVQADGSGNYTALLGATTNDGIPAEVFGAGQRWLGVQAQGEVEHPRVLMTSVPYSLKAVDAETLGGLPASAYALAGTTGAAPNSAVGASLASPLAAAAPAVAASSAAKPAVAPPAGITGSGTAGYVPLWTGTSTLGTSKMIQNSAGQIGIGAAGQADLTVQTTGNAIYGVTSADEDYEPVAFAVEGYASNTSGTSYGVEGISSSTEGFGVAAGAKATTGTTYGVYANNASNGGTGVSGDATATSGKTWGVYGTSASVAGYGVEGKATATSGNTFGVYGITASDVGTGVKGVGVTVSEEGGDAPEGAAGLWGDTSDGAEAILATADDTQAIGAYSKSNSQATVYVENASTEENAIALATFGPAFTGFCDAFTNGNLTCSGSVGGHATVNQSKDVALYSVQSAENWMEDAGSGQLQNGAAVIELEPEFAQTVNTGIDYHVFLTPRGDCKGLYVGRTTATSFEVHEPGGGTANIAFDYRIMARRKGFENIRLADLTGKLQMRRNSKSKAGNGVGRARQTLEGVHPETRRPDFAQPQAHAAKPVASAVTPQTPATR